MGSQGPPLPKSSRGGLFVTHRARDLCWGPSLGAGNGCDRERTGGGRETSPLPPKEGEPTRFPPALHPKNPTPTIAITPTRTRGDHLSMAVCTQGHPKTRGGAHTSLKGVPQNGHHPHPRWGGASSQIWGCSLIVPCCKSAPPVDRFRGCPMLSGVKIWGEGAPPPSCQPGQRQVEPQGQGGRGPPPVPPSHWYQYGQGQHHPAPPQSPPQTPTSPPGGPRRHH